MSYPFLIFAAIEVPKGKKQSWTLVKGGKTDFIQATVVEERVSSID